MSPCTSARAVPRTRGRSLRRRAPQPAPRRQRFRRRRALDRRRWQGRLRRPTAGGDGDDASHEREQSQAPSRDRRRDRRPRGSLRGRGRHGGGTRGRALRLEVVVLASVVAQIGTHREREPERGEDECDDRRRDEREQRSVREWIALCLRLDLGAHRRRESPEGRPLERCRDRVDPIGRDASQTSFSRAAPGDSVSIAVPARPDRRRPSPRSRPGNRSTIPATCTGTVAPPSWSGSMPADATGELGEPRGDEDRRRRHVGRLRRPQERRRAERRAARARRHRGRRPRHEAADADPVAKLRRERPRETERADERVSGVRSSLDDTAAAGTISRATSSAPRGALAAIVDAERGFAAPIAMRRNVRRRVARSPRTRRGWAQTRRTMRSPGSRTPRSSTGVPGRRASASCAAAPAEPTPAATPPRSRSRRVEAEHRHAAHALRPARAARHAQYRVGGSALPARRWNLSGAATSKTRTRFWRSSRTTMSSGTWNAAWSRSPCASVAR